MGQIQDNQFDTILEPDTEINEENNLAYDQQNFEFCPVSVCEVLKLLKKIPAWKVLMAGF